MAISPYGIHWFRRDLRVAGNPALAHNHQANAGRVLGLFCFDSVFLGRSDFSPHRFAFFLKTLRALRDDLRQRGGDLLVMDALPDKALIELMSVLKTRPTLLTFNRDYEPYARQRDSKITELMRELDVDTQDFRDHLIFEPHEVFKKKPGDFYQVYSPFAKKWFNQLATKEFHARVSAETAGLNEMSKKKVRFSLAWKDVAPASLLKVDQLAEFEKQNSANVTISIPDAGPEAALKRLKLFEKKLAIYKTDRDVPGIDGTSKMSIYLKNGSITSAQIISFLKLENAFFKTDNSPSRYLKEIVWREFYYHILFHRPDVETSAFNLKYKNINWKNNKKGFERWCEGTTGFPIVDAGMRQLNTTGWMHNRVRMIVASFLCKDLLIDWKWGDNYFMRKLLDGDMAPNNGGWQWAASTGCDPQPYFRIFNPWLQSAKFDPQGEYIKRYIPELKSVPVSELHKPEGDRGTLYPKPILDHRAQKTQALALYTALR